MYESKSEDIAVSDKVLPGARRESMPHASTATTGSIDARPVVLLTGATGYVGGRLMKSLESSGHRLRCLARRPEALRRTTARETEVVAGDVLDRASLEAVLRGVHTAYYLVHSMGSSRSDFESEDRQAARNFGDAARLAGVQQIIYLGKWGSTLAAPAQPTRGWPDLAGIRCSGYRAPGLNCHRLRKSLVRNGKGLD